MDPALQEYIERLETVRDGLDVLVRDARGLLKDMDRREKEINKMLTETTQKVVRENVMSALESMVSDLTDATNEAMEVAENRINKRFDKIGDIFLGKSRTENVSLEVLLHARGMLESLITKVAKEQNMTVVYKGGGFPSELRSKKKRNSQIRDPRGKTPPWLV